MDKDTILSVKNAGVAFQTTQGVVQAAKGVDFELSRGRTLGIVGESGSGKTVTALSISGLLPRTALVEGEKWLQVGVDEAPMALHGLTEAAMSRVRGRHVGMIFQEPMSSLNPVMRCGEQVAEVLRYHLGMVGAEAEQHVRMWLDRVKLRDLGRIYRSYPHELSGGQKQRVMIAMAMCCRPALLIADEPTTALDVTVQQAVLALMRELQEETGTACVFISHDLGVIGEIAHEVIVMRGGEVVDGGTVNKVMEGGGHAYTRGLLACRPLLRNRLDRLPVIGEEGEVRVVTRDEELARLEALRARAVLLAVDGLRVVYPGKPVVEAVSGVSFQLRQGEVLGVVGESGSGKTTLARCVVGLVAAASGRICYAGGGIGYGEPHREIQMIFQDPFASLNPRYTVGRSIEEPLRLLGKDKIPGRRNELLEQVGLGEAYAERYPHELSGGQRQRVCIARALSVSPKVLICDESVSALDVSVQAQVLNLLQDLRDRVGLAILFITHDLSVVRQVCDRVLVMRDGRVVEEGNVMDLVEAPREAYTRELLRAVPGGGGIPGHP
jgi:peptide/nickel transport system ATP-binding protein